MTDSETRDVSVPDDDDASESPSSNDEPSMVVSRARRSNAGSRMSILLAQAREDDLGLEEDEQAKEFYDESHWKELPDDEEFEDADDQGDIPLESSSDEDEDEGDEDEEAGEKALRKEERAEKLAKKRKAQDPFSQLLATRKPTKKPRADTPSTSQTPTTPVEPTSRPRKKSERASWLPTQEDGPVRTSSRKLTVKNKEMIHERLKEKEQHRLSTVAIMRAAEERKRAAKPKVVLTQEDRLAEAKKVEKRNSKSLNAWEREEERKATERQARLDALKNRKLDGPFIRFYSGPGIWKDDRLIRSGRDANKEELQKQIEEAEREWEAAKDAAKQSVVPQNVSMRGNGADEVSPFTDLQKPSAPPPELPPPPASLSEPPPTSIASMPEPGASTAASSSSHSAPPSTAASIPPSSGPATIIRPPPYTNIMFAPPEMPGLLWGIDDWANPNAPKPATPPPEPSTQPVVAESSNPIVQNLDLPTSQRDLSTESHAKPASTAPQPGPGHAHFATPKTSDTSPAPCSRPMLELASRTLLTLENFPALSAYSGSSGGGRVKASTDKDMLLSALFSVLPSPPSSPEPEAENAYDRYSDVSAAYNPNTPNYVPPTRLTISRHARSTNMCVVTSKPARYRDPVTKLGYADRWAFGCLRRLVKGEFRWNKVLGCYVGLAPPTTPPATATNESKIDADKAQGSEGAKEKAEPKAAGWDGTPAAGVPSGFADPSKVRSLQELEEERKVEVEKLRREREEKEKIEREKMAAQQQQQQQPQPQPAGQPSFGGQQPQHYGQGLQHGIAAAPPSTRPLGQPQSQQPFAQPPRPMQHPFQQQQQQKQQQQ